MCVKSTSNQPIVILLFSDNLPRSYASIEVNSVMMCCISTLRQEDTPCFAKDHFEDKGEPAFSEAQAHQTIPC